MTKNGAFVYLNLELKLLSEQLGTCSAASVYAEHVLKTAQKEIKKANRLSGKVSKALQKYKGTDPIPEMKEVKELQGIIRSYQEVLGKAEELPNDIQELLDYSQRCEEEFEALVKEGKEQKPTIFMKDEDGWPMISTHMIVGNLKENAKIMANNDTAASKEAKVFKSKVSVQEMLALDIKPVEYLIRPSNDIARDEDGKPAICERIIKFERMGKTETAIALSETVPPGTEYKVHLRVRANSPFASNDFALLRLLLDLGKNNGIGQWRGSGSKGQYMFKLTKLDKDPPKPKGYEDWD